MERVLTLETGAESAETGSLQVVDTTIVLFFLAVLLGSSFPASAVDAGLSFTTLAAFIVLPFFMTGDDARPAFGVWMLGRVFIAVFGMLTGALFYSALGTALPEAFRYVPMSLLLVAATASAIVQFYVIIRVRLAS
ncbi:MAG TPA: hypothetical protein VK918_08520 [Pyrinomonadaceae bacterium]|nr:hypothetical protein [Pyrinomonadaceae bacterium]